MMITISEICSRRNITRLFVTVLLVEEKVKKLNTALEKVAIKYLDFRNKNDVSHFYGELKLRQYNISRIKNEFNFPSNLDESKQLFIENSLNTLEHEVDNIGERFQIYLCNQSSYL